MSSDNVGSSINRKIPPFVWLRVVVIGAVSWIVCITFIWTAFTQFFAQGKILPIVLIVVVLSLGLIVGRYVKNTLWEIRLLAKGDTTTGQLIKIQGYDSSGGGGSSNLVTATFAYRDDSQVHQATIRTWNPRRQWFNFSVATDPTWAELDTGNPLEKPLVGALLRAQMDEADIEEFNQAEEQKHKIIRKKHKVKPAPEQILFLPDKPTKVLVPAIIFPSLKFTQDAVQETKPLEIIIGLALATFTITVIIFLAGGTFSFLFYFLSFAGWGILLFMTNCLFR
jgi:hypothetical protein